MRGSVSRLALLLPLGAALIVLSLGPTTHAGKAQGGAAKDIAGKFVTFTDGVLTLDVAAGKLAGQHQFQVPNGIPVLVYTSPGHPQMHHAPDGLVGVSADTRVEVTVDTRDFIIRVSVGEKSAKKK